MARPLVPTLLLAVVLGAIVLGGAALRIQVALSDPGFDRERPERVLKSDPALLYYVTERILEAGGLPPEDFRADPRLEHPRESDLPAMLTVGQEFLVAWLYPLLGGGMPLHLFAMGLMAVVASLSVLGLYGLARELTGSAAAGLAAAALWALSPAAYRTAGFILLREDLSLPLFAAHLWLLARALRVGTRTAFGLAGLALLAALATWHAMTFVATIEVAVLAAWFARTGRSPFAVPNAWVVLAVLALGSLAIPVLHAKAFLGSPVMLLLCALAATAWLERRGLVSRGPVAVVAAAAGFGILLGTSRALASALGIELGDYSHVWALFAAKLRHLGTLPEDPAALSFEARLLWQGPFETAYLRQLVAGLTVGSVLLPVAALRVLPTAWRGRGDVGGLLVVVLALAGCAAGLLFRRNLVLAALLAAPACAWLLARQKEDARTWLLGAVLAQAVACAAVLPYREPHWYFPLQQDEIAEVAAWIRAELPDDACVASDFVSGAAVLALTRRRILLQPKYETRESRRRAQEFFSAFFHGTPSDLRDWLRRYQCRYLLVDRQGLWSQRPIAGIASAIRQPYPGTAAAAFLSRDPARLSSVPGFGLRYRSTLPQDVMRVFEVE